MVWCKWFLIESVERRVSDTDRIEVVVCVDLHANDRPEQLRHDARQSLRGHRPF